MYTYTPKKHLFPLQYVDAYFLRFFNNSYVINKHSTFVQLPTEKHERSLEGARRKVSLIITSTKTRFNIISRHILLIRGRTPGSIFIHRNRNKLLSPRNATDAIFSSDRSTNLRPTSCRKLESNVEKLRPVTDDNILLSRRSVQWSDESIDISRRGDRYSLLYRLCATFSSRIASHAFLRFLRMHVEHGGKYEECQGKRDDSLKVLCSLNNTAFVVDVPDIDWLDSREWW